MNNKNFIKEQILHYKNKQKTPHKQFPVLFQQKFCWGIKTKGVIDAIKQNSQEITKKK